MQVKVLIFGQLAELTRETEMTRNGLSDTDSLVRALLQDFPGLATAKYRLAVDKRMISSNTALSDGSVVAMLPPFSGG